MKLSEAVAVLLMMLCTVGGIVLGIGSVASGMAENYEEGTYRLLWCLACLHQARSTTTEAQ